MRQRNDTGKTRLQIRSSHQATRPQAGGRGLAYRLQGETSTSKRCRILSNCLWLPLSALPLCALIMSQSCFFNLNQKTPWHHAFLCVLYEQTVGLPSRTIRRPTIRHEEANNFFLPTCHLKNALTAAHEPAYQTHQWRNSCGSAGRTCGTAPHRRKRSLLQSHPAEQARWGQTGPAAWTCS